MSRIPAQLASLSTSEQLRWMRQYLRENQTEFWARFGVTQSQGSRIEQGGWIPAPLAMLLNLYLDMRISDLDLEAARSRTRLSGADQARRDRLDNRLLAGADIEFAHDIRQVEIDGGFGTPQDARHLPR